MKQPIFITGIGTEIGKTIAAAIVTEALQADYWKPIQAGFDDGTDALRILSLISNTQTIIHPETYKLKMPASPHIAARAEHITIDIKQISKHFAAIKTSNTHLVIEGAGGIMVPLNENEFVIDLIKELNAKVILVSRNYLGSINHSLLTAMACKQKGIEVLGWIFNDVYLDYESEIEQWSGYKKIGSIPATDAINKHFIAQQAANIKQALINIV